MLKAKNPLKWLTKIVRSIRTVKKNITAPQRLFDMTMFYETKQLQCQSTNPLNKFGKKCFSQTDEDGITLEILSRCNCLTGGVYAEFGVGDGMENNTLILAALGWQGFWVGGEEITPKIDQSTKKHFAYLRAWITLDNIIDLVNRGLERIGCDKLDVISIDLDGNDIYFVEAILSEGVRPKLFIVEYNAKFPPPVEFKIAYDAHHSWEGDDYFGASLTSFEKLFQKFRYKLVCCNSHTGANAFFVDNHYSERFRDIPLDINEIYKEPRYWTYGQYGHRSSVKTVESILGNGNPKFFHSHQR